MAAIKSLSRISSKWARVTSGAGAEYEEGVKNPKADWAKNTADANPAWKAGIQKAVQRDAFAKGVKAAGSTKWQENAIAKGPGRFSQGVGLAQPAYEKGFAPFRETISGLTLPPRGAKGDPNNIQRVAVIAKALHEKKLSMLGG